MISGPGSFRQKYQQKKSQLRGCSCCCPSWQHVSEHVKYAKTSSRTCGDQSHNSVENGLKSLQREFTTVDSSLRKSLLWSSLASAEDGLHVLHAYTFDLWHK